MTLVGWKRVVGGIVASVLLVLFPLVIESRFILTLIIPGLIWSVTCMGWNAIVRTGQFSMGQAAFMSIGAYTAALLSIHVHLDMWLSLIIGGTISASVAMLLGVIVLRLGGIYFAIVTLAFAELIRVIAMNATSITMGTYGLIPPQPVLHIGDYTVYFAASKTAYYYTALIFVAVSGLVFWRMDTSRLGRISRSIASNPRLSEHAGMHLMKYRVIAFTVAGFFTGMAGALYSQYLFFVGPTLFGLWESIMILIMCTVGGIASPVAGPIIGALLLSAGGDYLAGLLKGAKQLVFGALVVLIVFLLPNGLVDIRRHLSGWIRSKKV